MLYCSIEKSYNTHTCSFKGNTTWENNATSTLTFAATRGLPCNTIMEHYTFRYSKVEACICVHAYIFVHSSSIECPKCVNSDEGLSCCGSGGSWEGKCGPDVDKFEHSWSEGLRSCIAKTLWENDATSASTFAATRGLACNTIMQRCTFR